MRRLAAQLPHGFQANNAWIKQVTIREFTGYDEQLIASSQNFFPPFKTSILLARITELNNNNNNVLSNFDMLQTVRNLSIGDRIALILQLRKITFGNILQCTLQCPKCTNKLSLDIPIDSILQPPKTNPQTTYTLQIDNYTLKIRPLNGTDLETITQNQNTPQTTTTTITSTPDTAIDTYLSEKLLRLCILSSNPPLPKTLNNQFQTQLSTKLSEIDRQADLTLNINCPLCNQTFQTPLDIEDFFFQEITSRYPQLEREIHWIALHYHWNEKTILSLPSSKRKRYIELINASISGENI
ncbi:MAG: hypothetical protein FWD52_06990 [Candidatus Bathyarchaeota archaeon]|nr:hypothetical protein [Candidatus Termiticorpusculum sp.]